MKERSNNINTHLASPSELTPQQLLTLQENLKGQREKLTLAWEEPRDQLPQQQCHEDSGTQGQKLSRSAELQKQRARDDKEKGRRVRLKDKQGPAWSCLST